MQQVRFLIGSAVVACAMMAVACGGGTGPEFGKNDVTAITAMTQDFVAAYNARDVDKVIGTFSGAAVLMPPNASTLRGIESIRGYYQTRFGEESSDLTLEPKDTNGHGPLAYVSGTYSMRIHPTEGNDGRDRGKFLWIVRNMGGGQWRWEYQMWSSDLPAVVPVAATEAK